MDLREIQVAVRQWRWENFPSNTGYDSFLGMVEEIGEIGHHMLKRRQGIRKEDHDAEIRDGCSDLIIFMMGLADAEGFDLLDVLNKTWVEVSQRDWVKYPGNGVTR